MAYEPDELSGFLTHRTRDTSGGFLKGWRKDGSIVVFLHRRVIPIAMYLHNLPRIHISEKDGEDAVRHVYFGEYVCWEDERTIKAQFKRDNEGVRTHPPQRCPACRLIECIRDMVDEKQLSWTQPIFRFDADDPKESRIIHAGGIYGHFGFDDLSDQEKKELASKSIGGMSAWGENAYAKGKYLFYVVNANKPDEGVQRTIESAQLGDRVKDVINNAIDGAKDPALGDPFKNPYAIKWTYTDNARNPFDKYKAIKFDKAELTPEIDSLISGERPDTSGPTARFNGATMRTMLERHCLIKNIPWDHIFAGAKGGEHPDLPPDPAMDFPPKEVGHADRNRGLPREVAQSVLKGNSEQTVAREMATTPVASSDDDVECDTCGKGMPETALVCPHCSQHYALVNGKVIAVAAPVHQPRPRKRSDG